MTQGQMQCPECPRQATWTTGDAQAFVFTDARKTRGMRYDYAYQLEGCWWCGYESQACGLPTRTRIEKG